MHGNHAAEGGITMQRRPQGILIEDLPDLDQLGDQDLADRGFINVIASPFHADPTGLHDSSDALQAAVTFGREHKLAVYFPGGTYLISRPIQCVAGWSEERTSLRRYLPHCDYWPCVLIGDRRDGDRPRIRVRGRTSPKLLPDSALSTHICPNANA